MDIGGAYYQSPLNALINGIDTNKYVEVNGNSGAYDIINIDGKDNITFVNFYFHSTDKATGHNSLDFANNPVGCVFLNCRFDNVYNVLNDTAKVILFLDCFSNSGIANRHYSLSGSSVSLFINCILKIKAGYEGIRPGSLNAATVKGCLFLDGIFGMNVVGTETYFSSASVSECTFYNQTVACINAGTQAVVTVFNNILIPTVGANDYGINWLDNPMGQRGSIISDYNCFYGADGNPLANPIYENVIGPHSIEKDPKLIIKDSKPVGLGPGSPCRGAGLNKSIIGCTPQRFVRQNGIIIGVI